jgi:hypothetical protein
MDGEVLADRLGGLAVGADPGEHLFHFVAPDGRTADERLLLREGEKRKAVTVELAGAPRENRPARAPDRTPEVERGLPPAVYVLGGVAALGLAGFATLGLIAKSKADGFDSCRPGCDASEVATMRREALFADISLGVGLASLAAMIWIVATHRTATLSTFAIGGGVARTPRFD